MLTDVEIKHIFYFLDSDVCNKADKNREVLQTTSPAQEIMNFFLDFFVYVWIFVHAHCFPKSH